MSAAGPPAPPWWQTGVVYQVYPRSFQDTNGDGIGDLPGITARLDHLVRLGVDAVWISPFYPSPMKDFGYDVSDYTDVDPMFGTLADFDRLLAAAHARGLRVIVDWVPNHTSDQHPWFQESRRSRDDPRRGWYVWRDARTDGSPPNNWLSSFGGPAWTWDARTRQYYLHSFLPEQPDLDWRNPTVRHTMLGTLEFWLDRGVDGFRIDCAHAVMKDPALRDNPPALPHKLAFHKDMGEYGKQLHVHDRSHPDTHGVYRDVRRLLDAYSEERPRVSIGEIHLFDLREWVSYYGAELDELHMPFNFTLLAIPWTAVAVRRTVEAMEAALPPGAWPNWVLGNHDEDRVASRIGAEAARAAMALLLTLRGTPTLYYGDELGMENVEIPPERAQDPWGRNVPGLGLGRDPERTPMQWDRGPNAGFTAPGVEPWLPLAPDAPVRNVEVEAGDEESVLSLTRRLLAVRRARPALNRGAYRAVGAPEGVLAFERIAGGDGVLVLISFVDRAVRVPVREGVGPVLVSTRPEPAGREDGAYELQAWEAVVLDAAST
ncbi:alpha-amylase family glycosyl hydrolase [Anaeromyxobacter oryzae]|uniref:Alpha-amylase n=1 Tax=Anaeromyxobacter oryzae TaxID=2918170 RepID=A0ABM7WPB7_9BACT|nr:alpha-amylase family glycosyl hydrolase [Anaeromyxobacter oryzae]BDG01313.1 alpha-amylase [Anaeromyxobacter oryzae]